jgi:MFS family permease
LADALQPDTDNWRRDWVVVMAATAGALLGTIHYLSPGVMTVPLEHQFGWSRAEIMSGLMIVAAANTLLYPINGVLIDRIGPRRIGLVGACLFCLSMAGLSLTQNLATWWLLWVAVAISGGMVTPAVWAAGVSSLFARSRGMALALTFTGNSIGAAIVPFVTQGFVAAYGWRLAYVALAASWGIVVIPLLWLFFTSAQDRGRRVEPARTLRPRQPVDWQALRSPSFLKIAVAGGALVSVHASLLSNYVPILIADGHAPAKAAALAGLLGLGSLVGRVTGGLLLDRINGRIVAGVSVLAPVITCLLLLSAGSSTVAAGAAIAVMGIATGIEYDAVAYLVARHFDMSRFGLLFGTIGGVLALLTGLSPFITSHVYDVTGSYHPAFYVFIPLCLLSSLLFFSLGPYPEQVEPAEAGSEPVAAASLSS